MNKREREKEREREIVGTDERRITEESDKDRDK